jgi:putative methionine-R-sulfoxide reductase with GAF domain
MGCYGRQTSQSAVSAKFGSALDHRSRIVGGFDIDSDTVGAFIEEDQALLDEMAVLNAGRLASRDVRSELAVTR